jgi:hypothetical protein
VLESKFTLSGETHKLSKEIYEIKLSTLNKIKIKRIKRHYLVKISDEYL